MTLADLRAALGSRLVRLRDRARTWTNVQLARLKVRSLRAEIHRAEDAIAGARDMVTALRGRLAIAEVNLIDQEKRHAQSVDR